MAKFPTPYPPSSISTSYGNGGINTNVQVPGSPYLPNNLDSLLMGALTRRPTGVPGNIGPRAQGQALAGGQEHATRQAFTDLPNSATTPGGQFLMNQAGNWGHFFDAADPRGKANGISPGFYGGVNNWDLSNPNIQGAPAYGKTGNGKGGGGGGGSYGASGVQNPQASQESNSGFDYLPRGEQLRWLEASKR